MKTLKSLFSYFLMKGLEGEADSNNDQQITNGELIAFINAIWDFIGSTPSRPK